MATLSSLKKRLKSIRATGDMAKAMKTVATVKYNRTGRTLRNFEEYSDACLTALEIIGDRAFTRDCDVPDNRNCYVLMAANRGFCGGFNSELCKKFDEELKKETVPPILFACGKKAQKYCTDRKLDAEFRELSDVPAYEEAEKLTMELLELYKTGKADNIYIISEKFVNMVNTSPAKWKILPHEPLSSQQNTDVEPLFLPDRETVGNSPALYSLVGRVYKIMLNHASSFHAATLVAMKSACDNADESAAKLELKINRIRQSEVTNSVIETSSGMAMRYLEN